MKKIAMLPIAFLLVACASSKKGPAAMAMLTPISESTATGMVHFQELNDGTVDVSADLKNVPAGVHGFHVHDKGDCSNNGNAAGGHFNPTNMPHAAPDAQSHHAGDFGNVTADAAARIRAAGARASGSPSMAAVALACQPSRSPSPRVRGSSPSM